MNTDYNILPESAYFDFAIDLRSQQEADELTEVLQILFLHTGRVSHMEKVMAWHPSVLKAQHDTYGLVMRQGTCTAPVPHRGPAHLPADR